MEMHQVRYFLALCEERNFTRAAKRCGVKQPSLSRAIKQLEAEFGGPLFIRDRTNARLSDLGARMQPQLARIDQSTVDAMRNAAKFLSARSITRQPRMMETIMRSRHVVAVVVAIFIGFGAKLFFFPAPAAEANIHAASRAAIDVLQMHRDADLANVPLQKMHDMTFVSE